MKNKTAISLVIISIFMISMVIPFATSGTNVRGYTGDLVASTETTVDGVVTAAIGDGIVNRYAIIVGISDYKAISDLSYADDDAVDWFNHLDSVGYTCKVLGDHTNSYPQFDGYATEYNVKQAIYNYLAIADADDIVVFATSGHGGSTKGRVRNAYLCMWDCSAGENGEDGYFRDTELQVVFQDAVCQWFLFIDHCYAGGMNEVMSNANSVNGYLAATCTDRGYGYDYPPAQNGAWTYFFLEYAWIQYFGGGLNVPMEDIFDYAVANYPYDNKDLPQEFDGNLAAYFYL
ncbi:MAG: caspase family protein [Candidatus Thorarchaeota archaeon]